MREGLRQLQEEGLIQDIPYKGTFVIEITPTYIEELYSLRSALESFALRRATLQANEADWDQLQQVITQMQQLDTLDDVEHSVDLDIRFHRLLCEAAHHGLLLRQWSAIEAGIRICLANSHRTMTEPHQVLDTHPDILVAVKGQAVERAVELLMIHIREAEQRMIQRWTTAVGHNQ